MERKGSNRLAQEKSPYLLQHADNPVDWYPWGEEAFAAAREQDKPIFLSIGYSTCHWCHVMEHESFENDSIAGLMNELFINIKVDREERPDVDQVYMRAVQAISQGGGGWPLSVFLTSDLRPFFGGTYFPPDDRYGRPGFPSVLRKVAEAYRTRRTEIDGVAGSLVDYLQAQPEPASDLPDAAMLDSAFRTLNGSFDASWGGFGAAPKFPRSVTLSFLMRYHVRNPNPASLEMVTITLDRMADGGMYDHLGGGFHRYSTDTRWLVPHFEKMLYDNALLARTYLEAYQLTRNERYARVARDIFTYLIRDMRSPQGGFYAAEDADSEGEEGRFYVWTRAEIDSLLGDESSSFCDYYDVTAEGNFEGRNILWTPRPLEPVARAHGMDAAAFAQQLGRNRETLLLARTSRVRPHRDEKILVSWNGLLLGAFSFGYQVLGDSAYLEAARGIADFILSDLWDGSTLKARWADGEARFDAYLDDYAFLAWGLMDLYEAGFDARYLALAFDLLDAAEAGFATETGGYYFAPKCNTELLARPQEVYDGAMPSGNSVMALNLLRRSGYAGEPAFRERALGLFRAYRAECESNPAAYPQMLCALDYYLGGSREIVLAGAGEPAHVLMAAIRSIFLPSKVMLFVGDGNARLDAIAPIVRGKTAPPGEALAYVCEDFVCRRPTGDAREMLAMLRSDRDLGRANVAR